jgi:transcriptional regulator with XRE-family HTH domain
MYARGDKMNIGCKLQKLRKEKGISQEELADMLGVSRQSVSKWESDMAYPETDKLIRLCDLYDVTMDSLLRQECCEKPSAQTGRKHLSGLHYEFKSKKRIFGMPLVHVNIGLGFYVAKGFISIGMISMGIVSISLISLGVLALGVVGIGAAALGAFALGLLLAVGAIALGTVAIGAIAVGFFTIGAVSIGYFSFGALSIAKYLAVGDNARAMIAIGRTKAAGTYTFQNTNDLETIFKLIDTEVPHFWSLFISWAKHLLQLS